jgi:hypothetical protein
MAKQRGQQVAAAVARAAKDRQFKALQKRVGILSNKDKDEGEEAELAPRTPQKAARQCPVVQSPQQHEGGH